MKSILAFLNKIKENNSKEWLDTHRAEYQAATQAFNLLVEKLIAGISEFDSSIKGITVKDCTYRFNRDIRFSANKMPYKTHFGAFICPKGKNSGFSGYYFHIEPAGSGYLNGSMLCTGLYSPQPSVLKSIREEIYLNGDTFEQVVREAKSFVLEDSQALKKVPRGYPADYKYAEYLKIKNPSVYKRVDDAFLLSGNFMENTLAAFRETVSFNIWLNKAVQYAYEE
jgi:uncharacterized protein (TIGR02453 family)